MEAIPTNYKGINFRSRLEAKWANMFDQLGWRWEYEPFDLDGYIPDFQLVFPKRSILIEVKPEATYNGMVTATQKARFATLGKRLICLGSTVELAGFNGLSRSEFEWEYVNALSWSRIQDADDQLKVKAIIDVLRKGDDGVDPDIWDFNQYGSSEKSKVNYLIGTAQPVVIDKCKNCQKYTFQGDWLYHCPTCNHESNWGSKGPESHNIDKMWRSATNLVKYNRVFYTNGNS